MVCSRPPGSIAIVADFKGPEGGGFVPSHLRAALAVRSELGLDVHFVFPEEARGAIFLDDVAGAGFDASFISRHEAPLRRTLRLRRLLAERSTRIVHSHFSRFDLDAGLAGRSAGARVVWHIHNSLLGYDARQRAKDLVKVRAAGRLADLVIANSAETARESVRRGFPRHKVEVVLNGLVLDRFRPVPGARDAVRRDLGLDPGAFVFLAFPWNPVIKGADLLVRAVGALADAVAEPRPVLLMTGGDLLRSAVEETLGGRPAPWLRLIGPVADVARLYAAADVFVSASRADAFSVAIGEAMASGLPVISSDIPGPAHFHPAPGCVTFPSEDWRALESAMAEMMQRDDRDHLGRANRAFVQRFDVGGYAARTVALYARLLACAVLLLLALPAGEASAAPCATGPFGAGNWPPGCWRPYADSSPFNRPVPAGAPVAANSAAIVARILGDLSQNDRPANLVANVRGDAGEPTYYSQAADPVFTLRCGPPERPCPLDGLEIRVPAGAVPEGGPSAPAGDDRHMTIIDQASGWEYDLWQVSTPTPLPAGGGELRFSWGGRTRLDGDGLAAPDDPPGHATAAYFGNLAGRVRAEELAAGRINHALFVVLDCDNGTFVYPARGLGQSCGALGLSDVDAPPLGSHLQLDMTSAEIDALPIRPWKKTILHAMAEYGMFFGDTGTDGYFAIETESGNQYQSLGFPDEWWRFATDNAWEPFDPTPEDPASGDEDLVGKLYANPHDDEAVDWDRDVWSRLRVLDPCVARGDCPDGEPPDTSIEGGPSGVTHDRDPSFELRSTEPASTFECMLERDGAVLAGWAPCTSPQAFAGLADGSYTFRAAARDAAGNLDPTPAERQFRVDGTPPWCRLAPASRRLADAIEGSVTIIVRCSEAVTLHMGLTATFGWAHPAPLTLGEASAVLDQAGTRVLTVRLSEPARARLARARSARLTARLVASDGAWRVCTERRFKLR